MTHKVHPKIYRIRTTGSWDSRGFYENNFPQFLQEDYRIRKILSEKLESMGLDKVEIERSPSDINVLIHTSRPGLIIGRGGEGVKKIKELLEKEILEISKDSKIKLKLEIKEVKEPYLSASLVAKDIARQIEKRMQYRKVIKQTLHKVAMHREVKGVRIEVSGRLNGVEISRKEYFQEGQLKRATLRSDLDYALEIARCSYGAIGVKVFIYKGEKF